MQYADQNATVHELQKMRSKTESVVSISAKTSKEHYHQCTVENYLFFQRLGFNSYQLSYFINIRIWNYSIIFQQIWTSNFNSCFYHRTWIFSDRFINTLQNGNPFLIIQHGFNNQWNVKRLKDYVLFRCAMRKLGIKERLNKWFFHHKWICLINGLQL